MICYYALLYSMWPPRAPVPGFNLQKLDVWEGSALADVWVRAAEYLDFRSYALRALSDMGFLDHLLIDHFPPLCIFVSFPLWCGGKTQVVCTLVAAGTALRRRGRSSAGDEEKEADDGDAKAYTIQDVLVSSFDTRIWYVCVCVIKSE